MSKLLRYGLIVAALAALRVGAQPDDVQLARARWEAAALEAYTYGYNKFCDCHRETPPETVVTVSDGLVVSVHHVHADSAREVPAREGSLDLYWTIDDLFSLIESATTRNAVVRARFDDELGYPTMLFIDYDATLIGDEIDLRLTRLEKRVR
jgi:hypothetical protein